MNDGEFINYVKGCFKTSICLCRNFNRNTTRTKTFTFVIFSAKLALTRTISVSCYMPKVSKFYVKKMITGLEVLSLAWKCVFDGPEHHPKELSHVTKL